MNIGSIIKKLRRERDMTQEQLAEYLNISVSAISQWESEKTAPDISLLAPLANIFGVTTDTLLGVDIDVKEKRIEAIVKEAENYTVKKQYDEAEKLLRSALKDYPNSFKLMDKLALVLSFNAGYYDKNRSEEKSEIIQEIITFGERILSECTDDDLRYWSIQRLCLAYASMGETEKAASFAKKLPNITGRDMITETLKGPEKYKNI